MTLTVHKAEAVHPGAPVHSATITIDADQPTGRTPREAAELHQRDADALATVLWATLPGATLDALLAEMLARRASLLRVPMPPVDGGAGR